MAFINLLAFYKKDDKPGYSCFLKKKDVDAIQWNAKNKKGEEGIWVNLRKTDADKKAENPQIPDLSGSYFVDDTPKQQTRAAPAYDIDDIPF